MKRSSRFTVAASLVFAAAAARADAPGIYNVGQSSVVYRIVHKLHKIEATSHTCEGRARLLPDGKAQVAVRIPVQSFDSGNGNRDEHMKEVVEAARYPYVELKVVGDGVAAPTGSAAVEKTFQGELTFHGVKHAIAVPVKIAAAGGGKLRASAHFSISLDQYQIERPSLLFVKVDDEMQIDADLLFQP